MEPIKRRVTAAMKKQVAGTQRFMCIANVKDYECPLKGMPFDEAGYEIDHILPLANGGSNDRSNLQALCLMCHRVKSNRASTVEKPKKEKKLKEEKKKEEPKEEEPVFWEPGIFTRAGLNNYPKRIQWKVGTNSLDMGLDCANHGYFRNKLSEYWTKNGVKDI
jgi:hypothetical protein